MIKIFTLNKNRDHKVATIPGPVVVIGYTTVIPRFSLATKNDICAIYLLLNFYFF